jgi:hypothetical protein
MGRLDVVETGRFRAGRNGELVQGSAYHMAGGVPTFRSSNLPIQFHVVRVFAWMSIDVDS